MELCGWSPTPLTSSPPPKISTHLEIPTLGPEEVLDVPFGVFGEAQHEVTLYL